MAPQAVEANRIAGDKNIVPDDKTKFDIARAGRDRTISAFKVCLSTDGDIFTVNILRSSGFAAYDLKILDTIRATWRYRPVLDDAGTPIRVCTAVTFIYGQSSGPPGIDGSHLSPQSGVVPIETESPPPPSQLAALEATQPGHQLPLKPVDLSISLDFGAMMIKPDVATAQSVGSAGFVVGFGTELSVYDVFTIGGTVAVGVPSDNASFNEQVMPVNGGDVTTATSSVKVVRYAFQLGAHTPFLVLGKRNRTAIAGALFANLGWAGVSGDRSIADCSDCETQPLVLTGGMYIRGGAQLMFAVDDAKLRGWGITAAYQAYTGDASLSGELLFSLNAWL